MVFGGLGNALLSPFNKAQEVQHFATKSPLGPAIERHSSSGGYHHSSKSKKNGNAVAMSALTLLSFFVFLNLLQSCLDEQMNYMKDSMMMTTVPPQTIILARRKQMAREAEKRRGEDQEDKKLEKEPRRDDIVIPKPPLTKTAKRNLTGSTVFRDKHDTEADLNFDDEFSQIPVKLKTVQKYQYP